MTPAGHPSLAVPAWNCLLFVPGDRLDRVGKAAASGADAVILDLEDGVDAARKAEARAALPEAVAIVRAGGCGAVVRINAAWRTAMLDIDAALAAGADAVMVPKVQDASRLSVVAEMLDEGEEALGSVRKLGVIALVESPAALTILPDICGAPRVIGLALGSEDFCLSFGVPPTPESLDLPCRMIALAASARGAMALGLPLSLTEFGDLAAYAAALRVGRGIGMTGALCIHPAQIETVQACFSATASEIASATAVLAAWDRAVRAGLAVIAVDGRMVDLPVAERARRVLDVAERRKRQRKPHA